MRSTIGPRVTPDPLGSQTTAAATEEQQMRSTIGPE